MPEWLPLLAAAPLACLILNVALLVQRARERGKLSEWTGDSKGVAMATACSCQLEAPVFVDQPRTHRRQSSRTRSVKCNLQALCVVHDAPRRTEPQAAPKLKGRAMQPDTIVWEFPRSGGLPASSSRPPQRRSRSSAPLRGRTEPTTSFARAAHVSGRPMAKDVTSSRPGRRRSQSRSRRESRIERSLQPSTSRRRPSSST